jgi:hypothetical protein
MDIKARQCHHSLLNRSERCVIVVRNGGCVKHFRYRDICKRHLFCEKCVDLTTVSFKYLYINITGSFASKIRSGATPRAHLVSSWMKSTISATATMRELTDAGYQNTLRDFLPMTLHIQSFACESNTLSQAVILQPGAALIHE